jgi:3-phosphoshikimate 1-carboxyvinyltransferase
MKKLTPTPLPSVIDIPTSKSYANRALILSALKEKTVLSNLPQGLDTKLLKDALALIGSSFPACEPQGRDEIILEVGDGGTTGRFLAALVSRGQRTYRLKLSEQLRLRPWDEMIQVFHELKVKTSWDKNDLLIQGPWSSEIKAVTIDGSRSSQFISAFILVAPPDVEIKIKNLDQAVTYVEQTRWLKNSMPLEFDIPKDWSSAAPLLILAVLRGEKVFFPGLKKDSLQGDSLLCDLLNESLVMDEKGLTTKELKNRSPLKLNLKNCQDLFFPLLVLCAHLDPGSELTGLQNLKFKETDRFSEGLKLLDSMGVLYENGEDKILFLDKKPMSEINFSMAFDHRLTMAQAMIVSLSNKTGIIPRPESVNKSFPEFWKHFSIE